MATSSETASRFGKWLGAVRRWAGKPRPAPPPSRSIGLALVSIPLWLVFEGYNLYLRNWNYTGLPENALLRNFGYAWSFATIWPAMFVGAELVATWRAGRAGRAGRVGGPLPLQPFQPLLPSWPSPQAH